MTGNNRHDFLFSTDCTVNAPQLRLMSEGSHPIITYLAGHERAHRLGVLHSEEQHKHCKRCIWFKATQVTEQVGCFLLPIRRLAQHTTNSLGMGRWNFREAARQ